MKILSFIKSFLFIWVFLLIAPSLLPAQQKMIMTPVQAPVLKDQVIIQTVTPNPIILIVGGKEIAVTITGTNLNQITAVQVIEQGKLALNFDAKLTPPSPTSTIVNLKAKVGVKPGSYQLRIIAGAHTIDIPTSVVTLEVKASTYPTTAVKKEAVTTSQPIKQGEKTIFSKAVALPPTKIEPKTLFQTKSPSIEEIPKPDLVVKEVNFEPHFTFTGWGGIVMQMHFYNQGNAKAQLFGLTSQNCGWIFKPDWSEDWWHPVPFWQGTINPGETTIVGVLILGPNEGVSRGCHRVTVWVNPYNYVLEKDDTNNTKIGYLPIPIYPVNQEAQADCARLIKHDNLKIGQKERVPAQPLPPGTAPLQKAK